jgi:hypothetical protein
MDLQPRDGSPAAMSGIYSADNNMFRAVQEIEVAVYVLERALIFRRLRLSLRERFFFHFSLMLKWPCSVPHNEQRTTERIHTWVKL